MLATRVAGETVGEVELVLCQQANVDAIAVRSTATLLLPPEEFFALVRESPATLHGLYAIAVRRHAELRHALEAGSAMAGDDWALDDATGDALPPADGSGPNQLGDGITSGRGTPPPPLPREATPPTPTPPPIGTYEALNGSAFRGSAAPRAPSPFAPAASFAPGRHGGSSIAAPGRRVSQAPASFIPPAGGAPASAIHSNAQSSYPPPSPFTPPPGGAIPQGMAPGGSVAPSVTTAAPRSGPSVTMVLAAVMTVVAVVLLTMTVLGKRPADLLGPAPAAHQSEPTETAPVATETAPPAAVVPPTVSPVTALGGPAQAPTRAPVAISIVKTAKAPAPAFKGPSASESAPSTPATPATVSSASASTSSTPATSASAAMTSAPAGTPASGSSDDFGGRQ